MPTATRFRSDYSALLREVRDAGLLKRRRGRYAFRIIITLGLYFAGWAAFLLIGKSWWQVATAVWLGIMFTQLGFLGHDGGHRQICRTRRGNEIIGTIAGSLLIGLSFRWWVFEHNQHHTHPNQEGQDPDIGEGVLAFTAAQVASRTNWAARAFTRNQAWLFFPLLTLEGLNLHAMSAQWLVQEGRWRRNRLEASLLVAHAVAYLAVVCMVLSPLPAVAFIAIHQAVFGVYMGCTFAPNHKGMPIIPAGAEIDFLRRQVLTARNVRGGTITDEALGGLNYQVEHHLFPSMARSNLHLAQPIVRRHYARLDVIYTETSLVGSYAAALKYLHSLGEPLRTR